MGAFDFDFKRKLSFDDAFDICSKAGTRKEGNGICDNKLLLSLIRHAKTVRIVFARLLPVYDMEPVVYIVRP